MDTPGSAAENHPARLASRSQASIENLEAKVKHSPNNIIKIGSSFLNRVEEQRKFTRDKDLYLQIFGLKSRSKH